MDPDGQFAALRVLRAVILRCSTVAEFVGVYDNDLTFRAALDRQTELLTAGDGDRLTNARGWAERFRELDREAMYVNECRSVCLLLLFTMCNCWRREGTITEKSLRNDFGLDRLLGVLKVSMPLDYAQCLFKMRYAGVQQFGMHWVADRHIEADRGLWNDLLNRVGGRSTMNKRYLWLADLFGLPPRNDAVLAECFQSHFAPWHGVRRGMLGEFDGIERDDSNMEDAVNFNFHALRQSIIACRSVEDFLDVYHGRPFQRAMERLRWMIGSTERMDWAVEWARNMRDHPDPSDLFCDDVRETLRLYLGCLRECSQDNSNPAVSEDSIVNTLQGHRVVNIMVWCLPMEVALCRHALRYNFPEHSGDIPYGMCWFSDQDAQKRPWSEWREVGPATMPPSFPWLKSINGLDLRHEHLVYDWVNPVLPEWVPEELDGDFDEVIELGHGHPLRRLFTE